MRPPKFENRNFAINRTNNEMENLLNVKIRQLEDEIRILKHQRNDLKVEKRNFDKHLNKNTCLSKWNTNSQFFEKSDISRFRIKKKMSNLLNTLDEHNATLGINWNESDFLF